MNDFLIAYIVSIAFVCVLVGLLVVYTYFSGPHFDDKLIALGEQAEKLRLQINRIPKDFRNDLGDSQKLVSDGLGDMGVKGMLAAVVPKQYRAFVPIFAPLLEGFLANPDNINKLKPYLDKIGIKLPKTEGETEKPPGVALL